MVEFREVEGYEFGERVEYRWRDNWYPGVITDFDEGDGQPFYVVSDGKPGAGWKTASDVRKLVGQNTATARQLQYRIDQTSGPATARNGGRWQNIEVGSSALTTQSISIAPCAHYQRLQLRQMIPHTDEEIISELRKLDRYSLSDKARDILDGKF